MAKYGPFEYERRLGQRNYSFAAQVSAQVAETEKRILAVTRQSLQDVVDIAQTPGISAKSVKMDIAAGIKGPNSRRSKKRYGPITAPENKGGKMRVDTGFLRASGQASLTGMPSGPTRGEPDKKYDWNVAKVTTTLANMKIGSVFHFGWTANYARIREAYDGFLESALQQWQKIVDRNCDEVSRRINDRG